MSEVTAQYRVDVKCVGATGSRRHDCIGAVAAVELALVTTKTTLLTGSGPIKVSGTLKALVDPKGHDVIGKIAEDKRGLDVGDTHIVAGRVTLQLKFDGIEIDATCYLDGARITHGSARARVTKFLWKFFLKELEADFTGTMLNKEILGV